MRGRAVHIFLLLALWPVFTGCGRPRIIPEKKMVRIYKDMFIADTWIRDRKDVRKLADSSLVFDPIFERYGYRFEDFDESVRYYLDKPDLFLKIVNQASDEVRAVGDRLSAEADAEKEWQEELDGYRRSYTYRDFSSDSLRWAGSGAYWSGLPESADSLATADCDTLKHF